MTTVAVCVKKSCAESGLPKTTGGLEVIPPGGIHCGGCGALCELRDAEPPARDA